MKFFYRTFDPNFSLLKKDSESLVEDDQQTQQNRNSNLQPQTSQFQASGDTCLWVLPLKLP